MPTICQFDGIDVVMYFRDHAPPHFHAFCGENEALEWNPPQIYRGKLRKTALKKLLAWALLRAVELDAN